MTDELTPDKPIQEEPLPNETRFWAKIIIVILSITLFVVLFFFVIDVANLNRSGAFAPALSRIGSGGSQAATLSPSEVQGWMTFHYVEHVFHIPNDVLQHELTLKDKDANAGIRQNQTIDGYAKQQGIAPQAFLMDLRAVLSAQGSTVRP